MNTNPNTNTQEPIVLEIRGASKQKYIVNGDPNKVLELNVNDLGIVDRFRKYYPLLKDIEADVADLKSVKEIKDEDELTIEDLDLLADSLAKCDSKMREFVDKIFDSNVTEVCDGGGTMYDPVEDGLLRYETIIEDISKVVGAKLDTEIDKFSKRREQHTKKYTKKKG